MKATVLLDIASCSVAEFDRRFRGAYCFHHNGRDETSVNFDKTAQHYIEDVSHLRSE
jgi:hypothetical protein